MSILEALKAEAAPFAGRSDPPIAVFVLGGVGTGKTHFIEAVKWRDAVNREEGLFRMMEDRLLETTTYHFDVDAVWVKAREAFTAITHEAVREVAVEIGRRFTDHLLATKVNFVTEGIGASADFVAFLDRLKAAGFATHVIEVTRDLDAALAAVEARNATTARKVSAEVVRETHARRAAWRAEVKAHADFHVTYANKDLEC